MAQITVKYDPTLKIEEIVEPVPDTEAVMIARNRSECGAEIQRIK